MKYRCAHCNHIFESSEPEVRHCPKCFWTTSVTPYSENHTAESASLGKPQAAGTSAKRSPRYDVVFYVLLAAVFIGGGLFFFLKGKQPASEKTSISIKPMISEEVKKAERSKSSQEASVDPLDVLTDAEKQTLMERFVLTVPRELSSDEEEILRKQASLPFQAEKPPVLSLWGKEDFRSFLRDEQARRKITLGGFYIRRLYKLFDEHYMTAGKWIEKGDYPMAREEFLKALSFPVYQNDVKMHRAVALVTLRPYINDVLGKIGAINQYLQDQRLASRAESISKNYQALFEALDLKNWASASRSIKTIRERVATFQDEAAMTTMDYPPAFRTLDGEIQAAIVKTTAPDLSKQADFKALLLDLDLKEKVIDQNTEEALGRAQRDYEKAFQLIESKEWTAAHEQLETLTYPVELVEEAKQKAVLLEKIIAAEKNGAGRSKPEMAVAVKQPAEKKLTSK